MKTILAVTYPFLFLIIPMLQLWYKNYSEVNIKIIYKLTASFALIYAGCYLSLYNIFSLGIIKTSLVCFCLVWIFYKASYFFRKIFKSKHLTSKIICPLIGAFITASPFIALTLNHTAQLWLSKILVFTGCFISAIYVLGIGTLSMNRKETEDSPVEQFAGSVQNENLPDIYYIVPDAYSGNKALKRFYNFDNSEFLNWLEEKNFHVYHNAAPNYPTTICSIGSTTNMDYIENFFKYDKENKDSDSMIEYQELFVKNEVTKFLKSKGYKYYHIINHLEKQMYKDCDIADVKINPGNASDFVNILFLKTLIDFIANKIHTENMKKIILNSFDAINEISKDTANTPKFVKAHILCPHTPFIFDKDGNDPDKKLDVSKKGDYRKLYLGQLQFVNKKLKETVTEILKNNKNSIIIIQADHGGESTVIENLNMWRGDNAEFVQERYCILRAVYAQNMDFDCVSSVNVFRHILNNLFDTKLEILPDKYIFPEYGSTFNTKEVFLENSD